MLLGNTIIPRVCNTVCLSPFCLIFTAHTCMPYLKYEWPQCVSGKQFEAIKLGEKWTIKNSSSNLPQFWNFSTILFMHYGQAPKSYFRYTRKWACPDWLFTSSFSLCLLTAQLYGFWPATECAFHLHQSLHMRLISSSTTRQSRYVSRRGKRSGERWNGAGRGRNSSWGKQ